MDRPGMEGAARNTERWLLEGLSGEGQRRVGRAAQAQARSARSYKGAVTDIRQEDKGQILAVALSRPERFLYEIAPAADPPTPRRRTWLFSTPTIEPVEQDTGIRHHGKEPAGGVVSLETRVINNIVVHCIANSLLREIDNTLPEPTTDEPA